VAGSPRSRASRHALRADGTGPIVPDDLFDTRAAISETGTVARPAFVRLGSVAVAVALLAPAAAADVRTPDRAAAASEIIPAPDRPAPDRPAPDRPAPDRPAPDRPAPDRPAPDRPAPEQPPEPPRAPDGDPPAPRSGDVLDERVDAGRHWRLDTARGAIHVWVPADYDAATAAAVVFVHGYWVGVDEAWDTYRLAQQFALSGINAMFIAPEAPATKWEPIAWPSLADLVRTVAERVDAALPAHRLVAVGHSGAYRTLALWLANPALDTVVLLDALYIDYGLLGWLRASKQRRLVNIAYETGRVSNYLHRRLPSTRRVDGLPPDGLPDARILYVRTGAGHWELVTDGVALPLALRAIGVPRLASAQADLPLGLPPRSDPPPATDAVIPMRLLERGAEFTP
jgi:hypothetical protein